MKEKKTKKITSIMVSTVVVLLLGGIWIDLYYSKVERKNYKIENNNERISGKLNRDSGELYVEAKKVLEDGCISKEKLQYIIAQTKLVNEKLDFLNDEEHDSLEIISYRDIRDISNFDEKEGIYYLNDKTKEVFKDIVESTEIICNWKAPSDKREKNLYTDDIEKQWRDSIYELQNSLWEWKSQSNNH